MSFTPSESSNPQPSTLSPAPDQSIEPPSNPQPIPSPPRQSSEQFQINMSSSVVIVVSSPEDPAPRTSVSARRKLFEGIPIMGLRRQVNAED
ncbi:uncharacterized protein BO66DRAFT_104801 [Aspergillus aculeatinus CBS 121060]|uniref:Uncharacterized protein n=1 Tax=Aspergillus aculeatinus CBS 121060 TaxID=1448322 RepID=A0ACD1H703_9EURO|nr:hypothetical protein BO66DRAFT_104801 [Aspergillus aculeatinus CBS 121060]RAH69335.1 hypothetical protein BO66DRAFT_104801 [Aspergillus aculeatinus CBS 121060]